MPRAKRVHEPSRSGAAGKERMPHCPRHTHTHMTLPWAASLSETKESARSTPRFSGVTCCAAGAAGAMKRGGRTAQRARAPAPRPGHSAAKLGKRPPLFCQSFPAPDPPHSSSSPLRTRGPRILALAASQLRGFKFCTSAAPPPLPPPPPPPSQAPPSPPRSAPAKPIEPSPDACCDEGCENCVWTTYSDALAEWEKLRASPVQPHG